MWSSWFGGFNPPSNYATADMPDWVNVGASCLVAAFIVPYMAFLVVLPGAREKRLATLLTFTLIILVGGSLAVSLYYPSWTVGNSLVVAPFRAHTSERVLSTLGVNVGLKHLNVTLRFEELIYHDEMFSKVDIRRLYYNEMFDISAVSSMNEALKSAFNHGLPFPMLSVLEYFSLNQDAFDWGRHYRQAGHYTNAAIWLAVSFWILSVLLMCFVPYYFGLGMLGTGLASILGCVLYVLMSPTHLAIMFVGVNGERTDMVMSLGWCFYLVLAIGILSVAVGLMLIILQHLGVYQLETFISATMDDTVWPQQKEDSTPATAFSNSLEMMRQHKKPSSEHEKSSSGFQSRSSYNPSLRSSLDSFELEHCPSDLDRAHC